MYVHALHTVHAVPELRIAGGRLGDGVAVMIEGVTQLIFRAPLKRLLKKSCR